MNEYQKQYTDALSLQFCFEILRV